MATKSDIDRLLDMTAAEIGRGRQFFYLASPYAKIDFEEAWRQASRAVIDLAHLGVTAVSPIAMNGHPRLHRRSSKMSHQDWLECDLPLMSAAAGLIVLTIEGWESSIGVAYERGFFAAVDRPIFMVSLVEIENEIERRSD